MKKIVISVLSFALILMFSLGVAAENTGNFISADEFFAQLAAEETQMLAEDAKAERSVTLSAVSGMDVTLGKEDVAVTANKQIVDIYNRVPAYYNPVTSGSPYQCSEYITRYYKTVYGSSLKGFTTTTSPQAGDYIYATAAQRGKSYGHYAVVKSVSADGSKLTLIEQNWAWYRGSVVYAAKNRVIPYGGSYAGTYTVYRPIGNAIIKDDGSGNYFTDFSSGHWSYKAVIALVNKGIISGYGDGTFLPDKKVTRAEFAMILAKASGGNYPNYTVARFNDVKSSHWAYNAINWAKVNGIVSGVSSKNFYPDNYITRQEVAQMLYTYAQFKGLPLNNSDALTCNDKNDIAAWALPAVKAMYASGVVNGTNEGNFKPLTNTTRAEACQMLYNLIG